MAASAVSLPYSQAEARVARVAMKAHMAAAAVLMRDGPPPLIEPALYEHLRAFFERGAKKQAAALELANRCLENIRASHGNTGLVGMDGFRNMFKDLKSQVPVGRSIPDDDPIEFY